MITKAIDEDCPVDTIYFDFIKAFGRVLLIQKMKMGSHRHRALYTPINP